MEVIKGSDRFRQLLKKFNEPKPTANDKLSHNTSVRKSNREVKRPVKYDASPHVSTTKDPKRKDRSIDRKNQSVERRNKSAERSGGRKDRSKEREVVSDIESPVLNKPKPRDVREGLVAPTSSVRSAFTNVLTNGNQRSSDVTHQTLQEPVSQSQQNSGGVGSGEYFRRMEENHNLEVRRPRDFDSSIRPELTSRRREPDYERGVFAKPQAVSYNQSRWPSNASQCDFHGYNREPVVRLVDIARSREPASQYDFHRDNREPVVRLVDIAKSREQSHLHSSRMNQPHVDTRKPTMRTQDQSFWQNSRMAQQPSSNQRYDGGFLRPATPPSTADLVQKEESDFLDTLSKFKNFPYFSPVEVIHLINTLEVRLVSKIAKCIRSETAAQSALRKMRMGTLEVSSRTHMVEDWLSTNDPYEQGLHPKRIRDPTEHEYTYAKKMRTAADDESVYLRGREPHPKLSFSLLKRMEDRRRMDTTTPISHIE